QVRVDPNVFQNQKGTVQVNLNLSSSAAVNLPQPVRLLINSHEPDQRGSFVDIPGTLSDVIADPVRDRFYVLRQDHNQILVYNAANNTLLATLRPYNTPMSMAITADNSSLLVGHYFSQTIAVYNLDTLQVQPYINSSAGGGHVIRS